MAGGLASGQPSATSAIPAGLRGRCTSPSDVHQSATAAPEINVHAEIDLDNGYGAFLYAVPGAATIQQRSPDAPVLGKRGPTRTKISAANVDASSTSMQISLRHCSSPPIPTLTIDGTKAIESRGSEGRMGAGAHDPPGDVVSHHDRRARDAPTTTSSSTPVKPGSAAPRP
jgi:hypothetical protein